MVRRLLSLDHVSPSVGPSGLIAGQELLLHQLGAVADEEVDGGVHLGGDLLNSKAVGPAGQHLEVET